MASTSPVIHLGSEITCAKISREDIRKKIVFVFRDEQGDISGLRWPYRISKLGMNSTARSMKGSWTGDYWKFPTTGSSKKMLSLLLKEYPSLCVIETTTGQTNSETGTEYSVIPISHDRSACLLNRKISYSTTLPRNLAKESPADPSSSTQHEVDVFRVCTKTKSDGFVAILAPKQTIFSIINTIQSEGAVEQESLTTDFQTLSKVKISTSGWAVEIRVDLKNPLHWSLAKDSRVADDGWAIAASTTRRKWPSWKKKIEEAGLEWEGDDPEAKDLCVPANFDEERVQGWSTPAANGNLLHAYQKEGAHFCASRGMRALIGDEMGIGKTVQAIAAAEATSSPRIVVICPANARFVWDREIKGWGGRGSIQHIESQLETLDMKSRWHILTYDLIAARSESWRFNDEGEVNAFLQAFPSFSDTKAVIEGKFPRKVTFREALLGMPNFTTPKRMVAWEKMMRRLRSELLEQILAAGPLLVILDEAHRVKNRDAKRTRAIQRIAAGESQLLMLTGTPLRNNEREAAVLLSLLNAEVSEKLSINNGYSIQDVKDCLAYFMIRRTKEEVLLELPEKTRQRIDLDQLDPDALKLYHLAMDTAQNYYRSAIKKGLSEAAARQAMHGAIEIARKELGIAKVMGGGVLDLVLDVLKNKECCVVFCSHHAVSDKLKEQIENQGYRVAIIDGRVAQKARASIVSDFQEGRLDVVIGGINAAGEAITLTRADTVVFAELDWVPAALLQAEDRIHRVGQAQNCQVMQLVARMPGDNLDEMMIDLIGKKMAVIGSVLDEDASNIIAKSVTAELHDLLIGKAVATKELWSPEASTQVIDQHQQDDPESPATQNQFANDRAITEAIQQPNVQGDEKPKRARGRPRGYVDSAPPTATERSKQPIKALADPGGNVEAIDQLHKNTPEAPASQIASANNESITEAIQQPEFRGDEKPKRARGRPKVYVDSAPPTATERSKQSIKALADAGGKRVMLRLSPEAHEALKIIMAATGSKQETTTINQAIIARKNDLLKTSTQNQ